MRIKLALISLLLSSSFEAAAKSPIQDYLPLEAILSSADVGKKYPVLEQVLNKHSSYNVQIIYTRIDRDAKNKPSLTYYQLGLNENKYFYPASTVKLPISLLALEWLAEQQNPAITADTIMLTDSDAQWQTRQHTDPTAANGMPSVAHYIKQILLVSDNNSSNRLYELMGPDYINQKLVEKGLVNTVINHRLSVPMTETQNRSVNPIRFTDGAGKTILSLPQRISHKEYFNATKPTLGNGYYSQGKLINTPMDFTYKNRLSLVDLDGVVKRVIFPELFSLSQQFHLRPSDRDLMLSYMSMLPPESVTPQYPVAKYPHNYSKFFMFAGEAQQLPEHIRIFNKTGSAYGHSLDAAYIVDFANKVEFFLTAIIYTNENGILNDDQYQLEQIGEPFLNQLGNYIYQWELKREKKHPADLSEMLQYAKQNSEIE